jgi:hypothetical protein
VDAHHQLEVLTDAVGVQAAHLDQDVAAEQPEGSADQDQSAEPRPPGASDEVGPEVLDQLDPRQPGARGPDVDDPAGDDPAAVDRPDRPTGGDHPGGVVGERLGHPQERVGLEHRVGVDHGHQRLAGDVDTDVEGLRTPAVLLGHDDQAGTPVAGYVLAEDPCPDGDVLRHVARQLDEVEGLDQPREGAVGAAVVDDHHLVAGVPQREQGLDRGDDARLLVVGGHEE